MKKQNNGQFVDCYRLTFNGKPQFVYLLGGLQPADIYLKLLNGEKAAAVIRNIFKGLLAIESVGFLDIGKTDCRLNRIFIEPKTLAAKFIYLPVQTINNVAGLYVLQNLRDRLIDCMVKTSHADVPEVRSIIGVLNNPSFMTLSAICKALTEDGHQTDVANASVSELLLISRKRNIRIAIAPKEFILRRRDVAEGNKKVGRQHARIFFEREKWYVEDLDSTNGTSVNGHIVTPGIPVEIRPGDILGLADEQYDIEKG